MTGTDPNAGLAGDQWAMPRGACMITATPMRQIAAPMMSHWSERNLSTTTPQAREPATNTPP